LYKAPNKDKIGAKDIQEVLKKLFGEAHIAILIASFNP